MILQLTIIHEFLEVTLAVTLYPLLLSITMFPINRRPYASSALTKEILP